MKEIVRRWSSRKFHIALGTIALNIAIPILFKRLEIGDQITIADLVAVNAIAGAYLGINILAQKMGAE